MKKILLLAAFLVTLGAGCSFTSQNNPTSPATSETAPQTQTSVNPQTQTQATFDTNDYLDTAAQDLNTTK